MTRLALLVPSDGPPPPPPEELASGRAALALRDEGIEVVFGDAIDAGRMTGLVASTGRWTPVVGARVEGAYDRYPARLRPGAYQRLVAALEGRPIVNPPELSALCQDKIACQEQLTRAGIAMPALETDPSAFASRLDRWGFGFLKPRYGTAGRGVVRVDRSGSASPSVAQLPQDGPLVLQRGVPPWGGLGGVALRVNVQRLPDPGSPLVTNPPIARWHPTESVVAADLGSEVAPAEEVVPAATVARAEHLAREVFRVLAGEPGGDLLAELGVDLVVDTAGQPHPIEVNGRPRGRLAALAALAPATYASLHVEVCCRPLRFLASVVAAR